MNNIKDGVFIAESSATSGLGAITLGGAVSGFNTFGSELADGERAVFFVEDGNGIDWFYALGTYTATGTILSRDTILHSSAGGVTNVSLSANTHTVTIEPVPGYVTGMVDYLDQILKGPALQDYSEILTAPVSAAGVLVLDFANGNVFNVELTENVTTLTLSNPPVTGIAGSISLRLAQDATGGRTFAFPASVKYNGGSAPTLSSGVSEYDWLTFVTIDGGITYDLFVGGQAFA